MQTHTRGTCPTCGLIDNLPHTCPPSWNVIDTDRVFGDEPTRIAGASAMDAAENAARYWMDRRGSYNQHLVVDVWPVDGDAAQAARYTVRGQAFVHFFAERAYV